jgi:cephalosporin hydroxylase
MDDFSVQVDLGDRQISFTQTEITNLFHTLYYGSRVWEKTYYRGHNILKCPLDMWIYQEMIHELKPDYIIESGTFLGGSALYFADMFDLVGHGEIITIDIEVRPGIPHHNRIKYLKGSSSDINIFNNVMSMVGDKKNLMVILDSDHSHQHVIDEMRMWHSVIPVGGYMIVEDSNVNGHPVRPDFGPGPMEAINEFLSENSDFEIDLSRQKFYMTQNPRGYLKRIE